MFTINAGFPSNLSGVTNVARTSSHAIGEGGLGLVAFSWVSAMVAIMIAAAVSPAIATRVGVAAPVPVSVVVLVPIVVSGGLA